SAGDAVAQEILKSAAQSLAALAGTVRTQAFGPAEDCHVSFIGGVFRSQALRERFRLLMELTEHTDVTAPRFDPAAGALIQAYRASGLTVLPQISPQEKGAIS